MKLQFLELKFWSLFESNFEFLDFILGSNCAWLWIFGFLVDATFLYNVFEFPFLIKEKKNYKEGKRTNNNLVDAIIWEPNENIIFFFTQNLGIYV